MDHTSEEFIKSQSFPRAIHGQHFSSREAYVKHLASIKKSEVEAEIGTDEAAPKRSPGRPRKTEIEAE